MDSTGSSDSPESAVESVLAAPDHYAAISAPRNATTPELRQHYLRASVQVHPDKTNHPDATKAFQRVTEAWVVLSKQDSRMRYDADLVSGVRSSSGGNDMTRMTPEEAFAAFAFAAATCSPSGSVGDLAETLFWAQRLSKARSNQQQEEGNSSPETTIATAACGIAMAIGLYGVGTAASVAGYGGVGSMVRRVAVIQGISQVPALAVGASQSPEIMENAYVVTASEKARSCGAVIGSAVSSTIVMAKENAQALADSDTGAHIKATIRSGVSAIGSCDPRSRSSSLDNSSGSEDDAGAPSSLAMGCRVKIKGLQGATHFNGKNGIVVGLATAAKSTLRYKVRLSPVVGVSLFRNSHQNNLCTDASQLDTADCWEAQGGTSSSSVAGYDEIILVKLENLRVAPRSRVRVGAVPASEKNFL